MTGNARSWPHRSATHRCRKCGSYFAHPGPAPVHCEWCVELLHGRMGRNIERDAVRRILGRARWEEWPPEDMDETYRVSLEGAVTE